MYGESSIKIDSTKAAWTLCGSFNPTGVGICICIPAASTPTITKRPFTLSNSCSVISGVSTHEIHFLPRLSVLTGFSPCITISWIPFWFVVMI